MDSIIIYIGQWIISIVAGIGIILASLVTWYYFDNKNFREKIAKAPIYIKLLVFGIVGIGGYIIIGTILTGGSHGAACPVYGC